MNNELMVVRRSIWNIITLNVEDVPNSPSKNATLSTVVDEEEGEVELKPLL